MQVNTICGSKPTCVAKFELQDLGEILLVFL